ncbi:XrtA/PEP-CTERM system exopolysaccharide export protein [endosymbiont of Ridgeia piscesae]|jgi:polysaccharide export outer membrane protein|nr:XrtA/PEP-CTERM system exopolysaccharide export protein [endosymbiont of Ridgeia piscesae]
MKKSYQYTKNVLSMVLVSVLAAIVLAGCASAGGTMQKEAPASITRVGAEAPKYLIGPGDSLRVFVWGDPELSSEVIVRPDGLITTPLVEDMQASGKTPTELARNLEGNLSRFIKNPKVTVTVTNFVGQYTEQIRVVGQAAQPQSLSYREHMSLLDVVIAVGGLTEFAAGNKASIVRRINGKTEQFQVRLDDLVRDGDISANVEMLPGDVLIIPETWF